MKNWSVANRIAFLGLLVTLLGILAANAPTWYQTFFADTTESTGGAIYRLRVTVVDPRSTPVEDARVWSSIGGEPMKVAGGWQFDIPAAGEAIIGATVSIFGHGQEAVKTGEGGSFVLAAHAADDQQVQLHVEMTGYKPANQWHRAGGVPAAIYLDRR